MEIDTRQVHLERLQGKKCTYLLSAYSF